MAILLFPFFFVLAVVIGAMFLRAAISLANKMLPAKQREQIEQGEQGEPLQPQDELHAEYTPSAPSDDINPFAAPSFSEALVPLADAIVPAIPEPNFGRACGIVAATAVMMFIAMLGTVVFMPSPLAEEILPFFNLLLSFLIVSLIYSRMLPTTFARGALVYVLMIGILLAIVIPVGAVVAFTLDFTLQ